jgi:hypothetical protein
MVTPQPVVEGLVDLTEPCARLHHDRVASGVVGDVVGLGQVHDRLDGRVPADRVTPLGVATQLLAPSWDGADPVGRLLARVDDRRALVLVDDMRYADEESVRFSVS